MRSASDICLLCEKNNSNQKNSHIIPKSFGNGLYYGINPRHSLAINKSGKKSKVQDIPKEDYLFCEKCEKGFSIFETYCILRLKRYDELRYASNFNRFQQGEFEYFKCKDLDIRIFNLFIYSIVWKLSVSESYAFGGFKLQKTEEDKLKVILKEFISLTQSELLDKLHKLKTLPPHSHVIVRPHKKLRPPRGMLSAASLVEWMHELHLVDFIIFYITDREKLVEEFKQIDNNNLENPVKVGLTTPERWEAYNLDLIRKAIKQHNV